MKFQRLTTMFPTLWTAALVMLACEPSVGATTGACDLLRAAGAEKIIGGKIAGMGAAPQRGPGGVLNSICIFGAGESGGTFLLSTFPTAGEAKAALARAAHGENMLSVSEDPIDKAAASKQVVTNEAGAPTLYLPPQKKNEHDSAGFMYAQKGNQLLQAWGMHAGNGNHRELVRKLLMATIQKA